MHATIYIVEDHPVMQKMIREILNRLTDLTVCGVAATAQEALDQLPLMAVDLALIDVSLPDMTGIDLLSELQTWRPKLPCLMLSGHQEATYVQRALAAGARGYVAKGNPIELADAIRRVLNGEIYLSEAVRNKLHDTKS